MAQNQSNQKWLPQNQQSRVDKSTLKCTHCNQTGHTRTHCFEIIGNPDWWNGLRMRSSKESSNAAIVKIKTPNEKGKNVSALSTTEDDFLWY